jgi:ribosomal protein S18 acetylase RimI-like enzyme
MASASWLQDSYDIKTIRLGVNPDNLSALNLYLKLGFMIIEETKMGGYVMETKINELSGI